MNDANVKKMKSVVNKLLKLELYEDVLKPIMYYNVVLLTVNVMMLKMHNT